MEHAAIEHLMGSMLAPWVKALQLKVESLNGDAVTLRLPFSAALRHGGGVICGQVFMSAADTAMVIAISSALGEFRPMTTVSLNISFMRAVRTGDVLITARVLRLGRNLVFGEVELAGEDGKVAAHATTTYALLNP